jgi:uncharacterized protein YjbI with pentapeptide repeats
LQGADLRGANLESAHLKGVINAEYALIDQTLFLLLNGLFSLFYFLL